MNRKLMLVFPALMLLTACDHVSWIQPLYTERDVVREPDFDGKWHDDDKTRLTITPREDGYRIDTGDTKLDATLLRFGGELYLDAVEQTSSGVPEHQYFKLALERDRMSWYMMNDQLVREELRRGGLDHRALREGKDTRFVVIAPAPDLQNFMLRYRENLWTNPQVFTRQQQ